MILLPRFPRFLAVGALNTLFGLIVYAGLITLGMPIWLALVGGNVTGVIFNFFTTGGMVFRDLSLARVPRFALVYLVVYFSNLSLIHLLTRLLGHPIVAQVLLAPPMAVAAYLGLTNFVYHARAPQPNAQLGDSGSRGSCRNRASPSSCGRAASLRRPSSWIILSDPIRTFATL
jgi:putative flippase GtrA